ncbi:DUF4287 domain-containing protein [Nonomuraea sp. NPDC050540]|uniref:DUF4287 domain-containing protein n=1 Tax=Nonomuraea sp. NPDC050540 TaxID=3364367 RepID=UPI00378F8891
MTKGKNHQRDAEARLLARIPQITGRDLPEWFRKIDNGPSFLRVEERVNWLVNEHGLTGAYAVAIVHEHERRRRHHADPDHDESGRGLRRSQQADTQAPAFATVLASMVEQSLTDLPEEWATSDTSLLIYLSGDTAGPEAAFDVVEATEWLLGAFDLEVVTSRGPILGSVAYWLRARRRDLRDAAASDLGKEVGVEVKRALQLRAVDAEQAKVDDAKASAAATLIAATESHAAAVIQVGALLLVKVNDTLSVRDLSPKEISFLRQNPHLVADPHTVLNHLQACNAVGPSPVQQPSAVERFSSPGEEATG